MAVYTSTTNDKGIVSCDWFNLQCLAAVPRNDAPLVAPFDWHCTLQTPTAVYGERWFVMDNAGNKIATILACPRSPAIDPNRMQVQIANRWLYHDNFHAITNAVLDMWPMTITGLNRVDLCCDFEMTPRLFKTYKMLSRGDAYVKALRSGAVWWQDIKDTEESQLLRVPHCLTFGGKESTFKWKIYYKYLELQQAAADEHKPYITDLWSAVGFKHKAVWRVEVSISNTNDVTTTANKRILPFEWYDNRVQLFQDIYTDKFVIRKNEGHKDKRNDIVLPFLELQGNKSIRHSLPSSAMDDSDPERRTTCKIWKELTQGDTQCNPYLMAILKSALADLVSRPYNLWALQRVYNVDTEEVTKMLTE